LEEGFAGHTAMGTPPVIYYDCRLAGHPQLMVGVALHELYHARGLGHANTAELIVGGADEYPSSLDALALWELWFSGTTYRPDVDVVLTIPSGFPYVVLLPYDATIRELQSDKTALEQRYEGLYRMYEENTKQLYNMTQLVASLREDVRKCGAENEALRAENARLAGRVGELETLLAERESALANLGKVAEDLRAALGEREGQVASLVAKVAELQGKLKRAEARGQVLFYAVLVLVPLALMVPFALALIMRRERR
jgi:regulator of replication initiation timing